MNNRIRSLAAAAVLLLATTTGGTLAANRAVTAQPIAAPLAAGSVQVAIGQPLGGVLVSGRAAMPGDVLTKADTRAVTLKNTGTLPLYGRLTVTKAWASMGNDGKLVPCPGRDASLIEITPADGWLSESGAAPAGSSTYYCAAPLAAKTGESAALIKSVAVSAAAGSDYEGLFIVLDIEADGVQAVGGDSVSTDAMKASWGVTPTFAANGTLTGVTR